MANELTVVELYGDDQDGRPRNYTIANGVSVSKGALLQLLDLRTASYAHLNDVPIAGVAAEEHVANQGVTQISCFTIGIFNTVASGAITVGQFVASDLSINMVHAATTADMASSYAVVVGKALQTATTGQTINVLIDL